MQEQLQDLNIQLEQLQNRIEDLVDIKQELTVEFDKALVFISQLEKVCKQNGIEIEFQLEN
tara:strand:- start:1002 stop:1184 length:183 start_codon:yes stop_codon:yes gene_type:complete